MATNRNLAATSDDLSSALKPYTRRDLLATLVLGCGAGSLGAFGAGQSVFAADGPVPLTASTKDQPLPGGGGVNGGESAGTNPSGQATVEHPLAPALKLAYGSRDAMKSVKDYQANFAKQEMIGRAMKTQQSVIKYRNEPFSVYLLFVKPHEGREVLFVEGRNNNQLLAHESGFKGLIGTLSLAVNSADAMQDNRYPITQLGMHRMLDVIIKQWEAESAFGEVDVKFYPNAKLGKDTACQVIESLHPEPRKQFAFKMTRLFLERDTQYPLRVEQYAFPASGKEPVLVEEYTYSNLKVNLGLTDRDFDRKNPNYKF